MGGFSAAIGGLGDAAHDYGVQVRNLLEGRRSGMANLMLQLAQLESDPNKVPMYLTHAASLLSGKDLAKTLPAVLKTIQQSQQSNSQLGQAAQALTAQIAGPPVAQAPSPTPPGGVPGTATSPVAAQPSSSPVQPSGADKFMATGAASPSPAAAPPQPAPQTFPVIPPVEQTAAASSPSDIPPLMGMGFPRLESQDETMQRYLGNPMWKAPANRALISRMAEADIQHNEALRQAVEQSQFNLAVGLQKLGLMSDSPVVQKTVQQLKAAGYPEMMIPSLVGSALGIPMPPISGLMSLMYGTIPLHMQKASDIAKQFPEEWAKSGIQDTNGVVDVQLDRITKRPVMISGRAVGNVVMPGMDEYGNPQPFMASRYQEGPVVPPGGIRNVAHAALNPRLMTGPQGNQFFVTPAQSGQGNIAGAINPAFVGTSRTSPTKINTVDAQGHSITALVPTTTVTKKGGGGTAGMGKVPSGGGGTATVPGAVATFPAPPSATTKATLEFAKSVQTEIPKLYSQIDDLAQSIGPGAGRWNQLWVNRAGFNDPKFSKLDEDLKLFATAIVRTHFGMRGGQNLVEALHRDFGQAQSPENLKERIRAASAWIDTYAGMGNVNAPGEKVPTSPTMITPVSGDESAQIDAILKKHGIKK